RGLEERREAVLKSIDEQKKLTPELRSSIESADSKQRPEERAALVAEPVEQALHAAVAHRQLHDRNAETLGRYPRDGGPAALVVVDLLDALVERVGDGTGGGDLPRRGLVTEDRAGITGERELQEDPGHADR